MMANKNPLSPLKLRFDKPKEVKEPTLKCPKCSSIRLQDYGFHNGIGYTCKRCNYGWSIGRTSLLTAEEKRDFLQTYNREKEDTLVKYSEDCAVPTDEYNRIEETIENNNEYFRQRLYGE